MKLNSKRKKIIGILLTVIVLVVATIIILSTLMSEQISNYLTRKSTQLLSKSLKTELTAREIKGNIFTGLAFSDVKIKFSSGDSFYATNVKAEYDLLSIVFRRAKNVKGIKIIKPTIYLSSKLSPKPQTTKPTLPFVFPLLFVNRFEIQDGSVYYNEKPILDSFSIKANLNLRPTGGHCTIDTLSFSLFERDIRVTNLQGSIDLSGKTLSLQHMKIKSVRSSISLDGKIDLEKNEVSLKIKNGQIDLNDFSKHEGQFQINTAISANLTPNKWQLSSIRGNLDYRNFNFKIQNVYVPDGKGVFTFYDTMIKINHMSANHDSNNRSQINFDANLLIKNYSYQGKATFTNFTFPLKNLDIPIDGTLDFNGVGIDSLDLNLIGSSKNPEIESISAQGSIKNGRILFEKVRIKDRTSILYLYGYYERKAFDIDYVVSNFSLSLASEIFNAVGHGNIILNGFLNGKGKIYSQGNQIASFGGIWVRNGLSPELQCKKIDLSYNLENITRLYGTVSLALEDIIWKNNQLDHVGLSLNDSCFTLQALNWKDDSLYATGKFKIGHSSYDCLIDSFQIVTAKQTIKNIKQFSIGSKASQFYLQDLALTIDESRPSPKEDTESKTGMPKEVVDKGTLTLDLTTNSHAPPNINLKCNQVDLSTISDIIQLPMPLSGVINIDVSNKLNQSDYIITSSGYGLNIPTALLKKTTSPNSNNHNYTDISIKYIEGSCLLTESNLKINSLKLVHEQDTSKIDGLISIKQNPILQSPLDLNINFANPGAWIFFFLKNILDVQEGTITGQGKITGTIETPVFSGGINIANGRIFIPSTKTQCEKVNADLAFDKHKIILTNLAGNAGAGKIIARGYTELIGFSKVDTVSYTVEFTNAPLKPAKEVYAIADGKINIDYKPSPKDGPSIPTSITGSATIKEALLTYEFASASGVKSVSKSSVNFNLKITGERDIWLRNRDIDVELAADLNIFNDGKSTIYSGELNALQGNFYYLDHILKLTKGAIILDNISELNPSLDITAELPPRPIKIQTGQTEAIKIILSLTGRLKEPIFTFSSDPASLSQEDIISYLTFNVTWQQMTSAESREMFTNALSEKLLGYFERELTKRLRSFIYLDYLMIESGLLSGTGAKVTVGKYIGRNLYFTYAYNITGTANDIFRLEYYITKSNEIIGERDTDGRYNLKYQYKIRY